MKKVTNLILLASLAGALVAHAQPNPFWPPRWASDTNSIPASQPPMITNTTPPVMTAPMPAAITNSPATNAPAPMPAMAAPMPAPARAPVLTPAPTNAPMPAPAAVPAPAPAPAPAPVVPALPAPMAMPASSAIAATVTIPVIQFSDVPLTTAIENLARQANINYMLDPKIGYGQPDQNGQPKPEPTLSIRWENISAENALLALLDNYSLQLVRDSRTGIARITTKDLTAAPPLITRVVQLQYASVSNMVQTLQPAFTDKRSRVLADTRTSQLVIVATDPEQEAADTLIKELDKPTQQVLIEAKIVEVSSNPSTTKGIDWSGTLAAQHFSFGNNVLGGASGYPYSSTTTTSFQTNQAGPFDGLPFPYLINTVTSYGANNTLGSPGLLVDTARGLDPQYAFLNADGVSAVLSFLNTEQDAQIVSTPRVVTLDNEMADISVTTAFPIINVAAGTANTTGGSTITYSNIGTILYVTPHISANDRIWLKVTPDISSYVGLFSLTVGGQAFQAEQFNTRHFDTQVLIPNGNTLVMGGLVQDNPQGTYNKVPILGDIPGLGAAFRYENKSLNKDNLLFFITPTIVRDSDFTPAPTDFLQSKPKGIKSTMDPKSWWDSSHPRGDWSDPVPPKDSLEEN